MGSPRYGPRRKKDMNNKKDGSDIAIRMRPRRRGIARLALLAVVGVVLIGGSTAASYYVDALWFASLGYESVFWTRLSLQATTFGTFTFLTFLVVFGVFRALKPDRLDALMGTTILVNRRPVALPIARFFNLIGIGLSATIAAVTGASMTERWMNLALYWEAPRHATMLDPIFGRSLDFYFFTLPAWQLIAGWLLTLAVIGCAIAALFVALAGGARVVRERPIVADQTRLWRWLSIGIAAVLLTLGAQVYLGRFERLFQDGTIFSGVTYTDAHVTLTGMLIVCAALVAGAALAGCCAILLLPRRWLVASVVPAVFSYIIVGVVG